MGVLLLKRNNRERVLQIRLKQVQKILVFSFFLITLTLILIKIGTRYSQALPVIAVFLPLISSPLLYALGRKSEHLRDTTAILVGALTFLTVISMYPQFENQTAMIYNFPALMLEGLFFYADQTSFLFALVTSFVWLLATVYSTAYMKHESCRACSSARSPSPRPWFK